MTVYHLRDEEDPVSIPRIVDELKITPASVNEMCRKLADEDYFRYIPYSGVSLTEKGEDFARNTVRKHRLWEVFLVGVLDFDYEKADEIASNLELNTPDDLADKIETYLEHPQVSPRGEPIPWAKRKGDHNQPISLIEVNVGESVEISHLKGDKVEMSYLLKKDFRPGEKVYVLAVDDSSLLLDIQNQRVVLARELAEKVYVMLVSK
jgi:DtxR family Mn-dependent transcriptional regulator